jgi:hypothetical protein
MSSPDDFPFSFLGLDFPSGMQSKSTHKHTTPEGRDGGRKPIKPTKKSKEKLREDYFNKTGSWKPGPHKPRFEGPVTCSMCKVKKIQSLSFWRRCDGCELNS